MQIKMGEKIKELRVRDGRTQSDLATAIGVSCQAVSRWEANGGYPDMEIVPAIANYFHVTIDELYGYHGDREEKIAEVLRKADKAMPHRHIHKDCLSDNFEDCVQMLRDSAEEFPNEPRILAKLATALMIFGYHKYGVNGKLNKETGLIEGDVEYNSKNVYWQEALLVMEKLLRSNPSSEQRIDTIYNLVDIYRTMGQYEKAKALAAEQNEIVICRELLLPLATVGKENAQYKSQSIIALLERLQFTICDAIATNMSLRTSEYGKQVYSTMAQLYETIFSDGNYGPNRWDIFYIHLNLIRCEIKINDNIQNALAYFDRLFDHAKAYNDFCENHAEEYQYSAPLICYAKKKVYTPSPITYQSFWKGYIPDLPQDMITELRKNPKYAECFAE